MGLIEMLLNGILELLSEIRLLDFPLANDGNKSECYFSVSYRTKKATKPLRQILSTRGRVSACEDTTTLFQNYCYIRTASITSTHLESLEPKESKSIGNCEERKEDGS